MQTEHETRTARVDMRMSNAAKSVIAQAAAVRHKSVTEFMLENSLAAAYETLADRRLFMLDEKQWAEFNALLDAPPQVNRGLADLAALKPEW